MKPGTGAPRVGWDKKSQVYAPVYNTRLILGASKSVLTGRTLVGRLMPSLMPTRDR